MRVALITLLFFVFIQQSNAQQWLGISPSNYGGTYTIYENPANVADSRYKIFINLAGVDASFLNNFISWNAPYSMLGVLTNSVSAQERTTDGKIKWKDSYLSENLNKSNYVAFLNAEVRGPSFLYTFEKSKFSIGLTTRARVLMNIANVNNNVARILFEGTKQEADYGINKPNNHFDWNLNGYTEIGATIGYILQEDDQNFFKVGATIKRINGLAHLHILADDITYRIDRNTNFGQQDKQVVYLNESKGQYGIVSDASYESLNLQKAVLGNTAAGRGYGVDIGFVYEFRPDFNKYEYREKGELRTDGTKNKYDYRFSVALLDIGAVKFDNPDLVTQVDVDKQGTLIPNGTFSKTNTLDKLTNTFNTIYGVTEGDKLHQFTVPLPMALSVGFDYKVREKIYVSAIWLQSLRDTKSLSMLQPSMFAISPRYETKWLEASMSVALQNGYRNLTVGVAGRAGPVFIGSDNLGAMLNIGNSRGFDIYGGMFIPIFRKLPLTPNQCYTEEKMTFWEKIKSIFKKDK